MQGLQSASPSDYFVDNTPTGESSTPEDRGMVPPPAAPASGSGEQPVTGKYQVEIDGKVQEMELTSDEVKYVEALPGVKYGIRCQIRYRTDAKTLASSGRINGRWPADHNV